MLLLTHPRPLFALAFIGCLALIGGALFMEHFVGLEPCPLCYVQRFEVIAFGLVCLLATLHNPKTLGRKLYAILMLLLAGTGIATAGRQIWLQHLPKDELPACLPPLDFMLEVLPLQEVITKMLYGSSDCAEVTWTFLGFNLAELSMTGFIIMLFWSAMLLFRRFPQAN